MKVDCYVCAKAVPPQPLSQAPANHACTCAHTRLLTCLGAGIIGAPCQSMHDIGTGIPLSDRLHEQNMIWLDDSRWDLDA